MFHHHSLDGDIIRKIPDLRVEYCFREISRTQYKKIQTTTFLQEIL